MHLFKIHSDFWNGWEQDAYHSYKALLVPLHATCYIEKVRGGVGIYC